MPALLQPAAAMQGLLYRLPKDTTVRLQRIVLCTCVLSIGLAAIGCAIGLNVGLRQIEIFGCHLSPAPPSVRSELISPVDPVCRLPSPPAAPRDVRGQLGIEFTAGVDDLKASAMKSRQEWLRLAVLWMLVHRR